MSISASAPDKRPALAFDNQTEIEFLLTAIESYRQGHILETYKVDWAQLEEIIEEYIYEEHKDELREIAY